LVGDYKTKALLNVITLVMKVNTMLRDLGDVTFESEELFVD